MTTTITRQEAFSLISERNLPNLFGRYNRLYSSYNNLSTARKKLRSNLLSNLNSWASWGAFSSCVANTQLSQDEKSALWDWFGELAKEAASDPNGIVMEDCPIMDSNLRAIYAFFKWFC